MDRQQLEDKKLAAERLKLNLEARKLRRELGISPAVPYMISAATASIAAVGLILSAVTGFAQLRFQAQQSKDRERVDIETAARASASMATDTSGGVDRRISGIYQLSGLWDQPQEERMIAATLTATLGNGKIDGGQRLRCAAAEAIGTAYGEPTGGWDKDTLAAGARRERLAHLLYGRGNGELGLVSSMNRLLRTAAVESKPTVQGQPDSGPAASTQDDIPRSSLDNQQCRSAISGTIEAIRKNWEQLRDVNLQGDVLDHAALYRADVANTALMGTSLIGTDFRQANLSGSNLSGATGYDDQAKPALLQQANVFGLRGSSRQFCEYALHHGAVELQDGEWLAWRATGFSPAKLKAMLPKEPRGGSC